MKTLFRLQFIFVIFTCTIQEKNTSLMTNLKICPLQVLPSNYPLSHSHYHFSLLLPGFSAKYYTSEHFPTRVKITNKTNGPPIPKSLKWHQKPSSCTDADVISNKCYKVLQQFSQTNKISDEYEHKFANFSQYVIFIFLLFSSFSHS